MGDAPNRIALSDPVHTIKDLGSASAKGESPLRRGGRSGYDFRID